MKTINIKNLEINTTIGVYEFEKKIKQRLFISLTLCYDFSKAMLSDNLNYTLDYDKLSQEIKSVLESNSYELIERALGEVEKILVNNYQLTNYKIEISKPSAITDADNVSVILNVGII